MIDRLNQSVNERWTDEDANRLSEILYKGLLDRFLSNFFGDFSAFGTGVNPGVLWGLGCVGLDGTHVTVEKGAWMAHDPAVTDAWENTVQVGYKVASESVTIPNAAAGKDRYDLLSAPATLALLGVVTDNESRDFKAAGASVFTPTGTPKRFSTAISAVTRTAGAEIATGTGNPDANQPALPSGHIRLWVVRKRESFSPAGNDLSDYRRFNTFRPPLRIFTHANTISGGTLAATHKNSVPGIGLPKAWAHFEGAGTGVALVINDSDNVASIARTADGNYTVTFRVPFASSALSGGVATTSVNDVIAHVRVASTTTSQLRIRTGGAFYQLAATEFVTVAWFGEQ